MKIFRREFLRAVLAAPVLGFLKGIHAGRVQAQPTGTRSLEIPEPPYPYAFGETYSQAGIDLQMTIDPHGEAWERVPWFKVGEVMHVEVGEMDVIPRNARALRMVVTNVDLKGGVITLAGVNDGKDAKQLDPWRMKDPLTPDIFIS